MSFLLPLNPTEKGKKRKPRSKNKSIDRRQLRDDLDEQEADNVSDDDDESIDVKRARMAASYIDSVRKKVKSSKPSQQRAGARKGAQRGRGEAAIDDEDDELAQELGEERRADDANRSLLDLDSAVTAHLTERVARARGAKLTRIAREWMNQEEEGIPSASTHTHTSEPVSSPRDPYASMILKGQSRPVTCVAGTAECIVAGSKDGRVLQWDLITGKRLHTFVHQSPVQSVSVSADGRLLATGCEEGVIRLFPLNMPQRSSSSSSSAVASFHSSSSLSSHSAPSLSSASTTLPSSSSTSTANSASSSVWWNAKEWRGGARRPVDTFEQHRGPIYALAFQRASVSGGQAAAAAAAAFPTAPSKQLFSASADRTLKSWDCHDMVYLETLFGHTSAVRAVDTLTRGNRCLSAGDDRTVRLWKLAEESHLVFRGAHQACIDAVAFCSSSMFLSGGQDGRLALWSSMHKKPLQIVESAHAGGTATQANGGWISAIAALQGTDLAASGSCDGRVRLWQTSLSKRAAGGADAKQLLEVGSLIAPGFVNGLSFGPRGQYLVAACGKEHRLGRWAQLKEAQNCVLLYALPGLSESAISDGVLRDHVDYEEEEESDDSQ